MSSVFKLQMLMSFCSSSVISKVQATEQGERELTSFGQIQKCRVVYMLIFACNSSSGIYVACGILLVNSYLYALILDTL